MNKVDTSDIRSLLAKSSRKLPEAKRVSILGQYQLAEMQQHWPSIVGETMAAHSYAYRLSEKKVFIQVDHGIYAQQLQLQQNTICAKIKEKLNRDFQAIQVRVGQIYWASRLKHQPKVRDIMSSQSDMVVEEHPNQDVLQQLIQEINKL